MIKGRGFHLSEEAREALVERVESEMQLSSAESGNGRMIRNIVEEGSVDSRHELVKMDTNTRIQQNLLLLKHQIFS